MKSANNSTLDAAVKQFYAASMAAQAGAIVGKVALGAQQVAVAIKGEASDKIAQALANSAEINFGRLSAGVSSSSPTLAELRTLALGLQQIAAALKELSG